MKIIGCGTADRGDDAAGLLVARRLRELGVDACEHTSEGLSLMESWTGAGTVILIDAVMTGGACGAVSVWNASDAPVVADFVRCSSHVFGVAEAVRLSRVLGRLPRQLTIYGIEGRRFDLGSAPCDEVVAAVEEVACTLARYCRSSAVRQQEHSYYCVTKC